MGPSYAASLLHIWDFKGENIQHPTSKIKDQIKSTIVT